MDAKGKPNSQASLKETLRLLRIASGPMTRQELAGKLNVTPAYIGYIEDLSSRKRPSLELLDEYAKVFHIQASDIMHLAEQNADGTYQHNLRRVLELLIKTSDEKENTP